MQKNIKVSFSDKEFTDLQALADSQDLTITALVRNEALKLIGVLETELTVSMVDQQASEFESKKEFKIRDLYSKEQWAKFSKRSKLSVGRKFYNEVTNVNSPLYKKYEFLGKTSGNAAIYKKLY